jgi:hypothetical protein
MMLKKKPRPPGVQPVVAREPTWLERVKEAVCDVIFFPNPPRVHIEP